MNQKNYEYLQDQVKFTGFGPELQADLKIKMEQGDKEFQLNYQKQFGNDVASSTLHFKLSDQGNYFFNKYDMQLKQGHSSEAINQTFYIGKENNITHKEAFNLLSGRSVNKDLVNREGEKYNAWVKLDFKETEQNGNFKMKHFSENYGFKLEEVLGKFPVKELGDPEQKKQLMDSLQKGNIQSVTFVRDGKEEKQFIEASPQFKSINVYDDNMKRIRQGQNEKEDTGQSESKSTKKEVKNKESAGDEGDEAGGKPKKTRSRKVS